VRYLFTDRDLPTDPAKPNAYHDTYVNLARGKFPEGTAGTRMRRDKYLELYGILPTFTLLRDRFHDDKTRDCAGKFDADALAQYEGSVGYGGSNDKARGKSAQFAALERVIEGILREQGIDDPADIDRTKLSKHEKERLTAYEKMAPAARAIRAAQIRLKCEGFFDGKGKPIDGVLDWSTNDALAEFERKHRLFGWGFIKRDTLEGLRTPPLEGERQAVLRGLVERAMLAAGVIEDGSTANIADGKPRTFTGTDGKEHTMTNYEQAYRDAAIKAFGLDTPESTLAWLESLGKLDGHRYLAFQGPPLPEYYTDDMKLSVIIDRGDVWYEFPYDEQGKERPQPEKHRPKLMLFTEYQGKSIPIARYGTTIGSWRGENIDGTVMWKYKNSPVGSRVWKEIVASPVWLPPDGTPPKSLLQSVPGKTGQDGFDVKYDEIGPGYASAYGLVAAYHLKYRKKDDGTIETQGDEGIRTHGSVDYMSIMDRHSHGCHRLHNHIAVRLMSFVLAHRPHQRVGQQHIKFRMPLKYQDPNNKEQEQEYEYEVKVDDEGYVFELAEPLPVEVLKGTIKGRRKTPIEDPLPKYNDEAQAYVMPDGTHVTVDRFGTITPIASPASPVAAPDGVDGGVAPASATITPGPGTTTTTATVPPTP
jgi:hypothetical protein